MAAVSLSPSSLPRDLRKDEKEFLPQEYLNAYDKILYAEDYASQNGLGDQVMHARVVGYLIIEFLKREDLYGATPCETITRGILGPKEPPGVHDVVFKLGEWYKNNFLRMFWTPTTGYPESNQSLHPSRQSFETIRDMAREYIEADGKDHRTSKCKVLARDGFRCILTGMVNSDSREKIPELARKCEEERIPDCPLQACHILNESTMQGIDPDGNVATEYATTALSILEDFGCVHLADELKKANGIHSPKNMLSMQPICHIYFDNLQLWFERHPDKKFHRYYVQVFGEGNAQFVTRDNYLETDERGRPFVTFSCDEKLIPDPQLLGLHAVCARVAHMSGAAEAFDQLDRDVEEIMVLASDGSSAPLLDHVLIPLAAIPGVA